MIISRISPVSGKTNVMEINVTHEQLLNWQNGMLIQDAIPHLTDEEREFIMSGIMPDEWDEMFRDDESDYYDDHDDDVAF